MNNMPVRKARKMNKRNEKKRGENNQIKGKSGRGRTRAQGRRKLAKVVEAKEKEAFVAAQAASAGEGMAMPVSGSASYIDLAKQQEERARMNQEHEQAERTEGEPPGPQTKKGRKRKRLREAAQRRAGVREEKSKPQQFENSHIAKENIRAGTVQFGDDGDDGGGRGKGKGPVTGSSAAASSTSRAGPRQSEELQPGSCVGVFGLQGAPELNGKSGTCVQWEAVKGRWQVRLDGSGEEKFIRPANLRPAVAEQQAAATALFPGCPVRLLELVASHELNGRLATCKSWDGAAGRWLVALSGGEEKSLKPENLEIALSLGVPITPCDLQAAPELNGKAAICIKWDAARQRWLVRMEGGVEKLLRFENIRISRTPEEQLPFSAAIVQRVRVCEDAEKPKLLIQAIREVREEEKRSRRQRLLMLILCESDATLDSLAEGMSAAGWPYTTLRDQDGPQRQQHVLGEFHLDKKRILIATRDAAQPVTPIDIGHVVNYEFPASAEAYCQSLLKLPKIDGAVAQSFFTSTSTPLAPAIVSFLKRARARIEPRLEELAAAAASADSAAAPSEEAAGAGGASRSLKRRPKKRRKDAAPA